LDNLKDLKAGVETQSHMAGMDDSKDELQQPLSTGEKQRQPRQTQLADLLSAAEPPAHGKRPPSVVDYTPSLDKKDTKVAAKDIRTLPGLRHQRWPVGYWHRVKMRDMDCSPLHQLNVTPLSASMKELQLTMRPQSQISINPTTL
jgi:hypothetical protein